MNSPEVIVVDYGIGNLLSVRRGLETCGATVTVTSDPDTILAAGRVVLPGVGAFAKAMDELRLRKLDTVIRDVASKGTPLMGICLGMQMLFDESEEFGLTKGLGLLPGRVIPIPSTNSAGEPVKIPHIGWSSLILPAGRQDWESSILQNIKPGDAVYLVHSFMAHLSDARDGLAECLYDGVHVSTAVCRRNVSGCQFHPEKSGEVGLRILRKFIIQ